MNEIESLLNEADEIVKAFKDLELYKKYKILKKNVENDAHLRQIKTDREKLQPTIKFLKGAKKDEAMKICKELQIEYDNSPLVINYLNAKNELLDLIRILTETIF